MEDPRVAMQDALKTAMREKDNTTRNAIRMTLNAIKQVEVDNRKEVSPEEAVDIMMKEVKKRRDTIAELEEAGREEMLAEEQAYLEVVERFLPEQLSREEIEVIVQDVIEKTGASSPRDMGQVMGATMPRVKGKADGKLVNEVVRDLLQKKG